MWSHRGDRVKCPICERGFDHFKPYWNRADALCWRCGSHERHRALWMFLQGRPDLLPPGTRLLHFAPEWGLERRLRAWPGMEYVNADLDAEGVDLHLDITKLDLPPASFDAIICSHVLEHVEEDQLAMRELRRVLKPGGWAIVMVPIDHGRQETYEDPGITTPEERLAAYWQHDHLRLYAPDIAGRLSEAGFTVERNNVHEEVGAELAIHFGLLSVDDVFLCRAG